MTQNGQILEYLMKHKGITPMDALSEIGCMRLGARIWELRNVYMIRIESKKKVVPTRSGSADVAFYWIEDKTQPTIEKALEKLRAA